MLARQRGALNMYAVVILSAAAGKLAGDSAKAVVTDSAGGQMRKCKIDGKVVVSNTACADQNKTTKVIKILDSRGFEAPPKPAKPPAEPGPDKIRDKMIEKQRQ
jgi:hypothetical protein